MAGKDLSFLEKIDRKRMDGVKIVFLYQTTALFG